jgi:hypothetical protein
VGALHPVQPLLGLVDATGPPERQALLEVAAGVIQVQRPQLGDAIAI